jgi:hypothetical protein
MTGVRTNVNLKNILLSISCVMLAAAASAQKPISHTVLAQDRGRVVILDEAGKITWETPCGGTCHDIAMLPNGNVLFPTDDRHIVEMTPAKQIVWQHTSGPKEGYSGDVQIHAFQRLDNGRTMVAESGNGRIIEVDSQDKIVFQMPLTLDHPNPHRDTRRARELKNGHFLVCHEGDGVVREYDRSGKVVWSYKLDLDNHPATDGHDGHGINVFNAIRLPNGNTLIGCGNGNRVVEVTPAGEEVWRVGYSELPGVTFRWITTLELLPNGHIVIGNTHAGPDNPQLIEVTRDKQVVWTLKNWDVLGNDTAAAWLVDVKGKVIR